jgi:hypothetical protein
MPVSKKEERLSMQYSNWYIFLLRTQSKHRYAYTIGACVLIFFGWSFFWYMPIERSLSQYIQEIKQSKQDAESFIEQHSLCKKLSDEILKLQNEIQGFSAHASSQESDVSLYMQYLRDAGLRLVSLRGTDQKKHAEFVDKHTTFDAIGSFSSCVQFFKMLSEQRTSVQCDDFSLQRQADETYLLHCILRKAVFNVA